jgi:diaminopimelate epimerase
MPGGGTVKFLKMEGLGNDFVVLEGPFDVQADQVAAWCNRRRGIGADGVLVVTPLADDRVRMEYWNADGSPAEMCGNGLRCVARLAHDRGWVASDVFTVVTAVGEREARIGAHVTVQVGIPETVGEEAIEVAGVVARAVDVGNPHAVVFVDDPADIAVDELGLRMGTDPVFPNGANIGFAALRGESLIELRVWERGVGETLACGSGAAAAVAVAHRLGRVGPTTTVRLPGGDLVVTLDERGAWLTGPANYVFEGVWRSPT